MGKAHKGVQTKRVYYGPNGGPPYWTVKVSRAKQDVVVQGSVLHALSGFPGSTIACGISNVICDKANAGAFPHKALLASVTPTTALVIDKTNKKGEPCHAVWYEHRYKHITELNDKRLLKKMVLENPSIMERPLTLRVPREQTHDHPYHPQNRSEAGKKPRGAHALHRGALKRAVAAGLISEPVAKQMEQVAQSSKEDSA